MTKGPLQLEGKQTVSLGTIHKVYIIILILIIIITIIIILLGAECHSGWVAK